MKLPKSLQEKLNDRLSNNALRVLPTQTHLIDFSSNDYLGFARNESIFNQTHQLLLEKKIKINGATGSRLISGNHDLYMEAEDFISKFHQSESALIFNSGYDANVGFFSAIPQRNDIILYDELCHASIRDGIQISHARAFKFQHNNTEDLASLLLKYQSETNEIYVVTESVFSMDGDAPDITKLIHISEQHGAYLVVDEAHALGIFGENGEGLVQSLGFENKIFARIMTFGKGLGCHGATILGSQELKSYLVNFARSFIYTTGLSPHAVATIFVAYKKLADEQKALQELKTNIRIFNQKKKHLHLEKWFVPSESAIHCAIIPSNEKVKSIAKQLQEKGFDVKAILSPTVPESQERLRFCLHSYNSEQEISMLLQQLKLLIF